MLSLKESIARAQKLPRDEAIILGRAKLLESRDEDLIKAVFVHGQSAEGLARLMGASADALRSRIKRLVRRMAGKRFLDAARAMHYLSAQDAELAKLVFCQALPQREVCVRLGITWHALRRRLDRVAAEIAVISRLRRPDELAPPPGGQDAFSRLAPTAT